MAASKRMRNHGALIGVPSLVDVVAETVCNSLEAKHFIWVSYINLSNVYYVLFVGACTGNFEN